MLEGGGHVKADRGRSKEGEGAPLGPWYRRLWTSGVKVTLKPFNCKNCGEQVPWNLLSSVAQAETSYFPASSFISRPFPASRRSPLDYLTAPLQTAVSSWPSLFRYFPVTFLKYTLFQNTKNCGMALLVHPERCRHEVHAVTWGPLHLSKS